MKSLEARVAYLEGLLQQARPEVALDHLGPNQSLDTELDLPDTSPTQPIPIMNMTSALPNLPDHSSFDDMELSRALRVPSIDAEDHHVDLLSSEVALLCLSAAGREPHYFGPSSAVSFSRIKYPEKYP
ncbi:fungal specific transcription factor [Colletotrichum tofieldiae]|nr:fungal specific transcription factor [Colletotrichum tofieldiae]GKT76366.1 fungal specific transcription factor [Colletotrichum tofieldiae]